MVRLYNFDYELDDAGRRVEHATLLPFLHGEGAEEVLVDLAERVTLEIDWCKQAQQLHLNAIFEPRVVARKHTFEISRIRKA